MDYLWAYERVEAIQVAVAQELERFGLTVPRGDVDLQVCLEIVAEGNTGIISPLSPPLAVYLCQWCRGV